MESVPKFFVLNLDTLNSELLSQGDSPKAAFTKVKSLTWESTLARVLRPNNNRVVVCLPFGRQLPNVTQIILHIYKIEKPQMTST